LSVALGTSTTLGPHAARAGSTWLPLVIGNRWEYVDTGGGQHAEVIDTTITFQGRAVFVKSYFGGINTGLENYWMIDPDGSVELCGFWDGRFGLAYEPPLKMLAAPPSVGQAWSTHTVAYRLPDMTLYETFDTDWRVEEEVLLHVPAGSYDCLAVSQVERSGGLAHPPGRTLDGRKLASAIAGSTPSAPPVDWWADDVGFVQFLSGGELYRLQSFRDVTPVRPFTWGRLKQLYR
jgi:hypothetical protein